MEVDEPTNNDAAAEPLDTEWVAASLGGCGAASQVS